MKPPHTSRPAKDLPVRVPGGARRIGSGPAPSRQDAPADDAAPEAPVSGRQEPGGTADVRDPLPRLTQFASLGFRGEPAGSRPGIPGDGFAGGGSAGGSGPGGDAGRRPAPDKAPPTDRRAGDQARREGFRGALSVVGIVGLLSAGCVLLTLGLVNHDGGTKRQGTSMVIGSDGGVTDAGDPFDGPVPSVSAPGTEADKGGTSPVASASSSPAPGPEPKHRPASGASGTPEAPASAGAADAPTAGPSTGAAVQGRRVVSHASDRCIDIAGGAAVRGAGLMISDCSGSASQRWTFASDGTMRGLGMCVQLAGRSTTDGTDFVMARCDGGPAQRIVLNVRHDLVSALADKCADVRDNGTANGTGLQLWTCAGSPNQKWSTA
ncbi:ricin-type beta-trefoil lectin domain protein [Streptomyces sp. NPDC056796]|uniref:ricin-type beta-trefoil lectin domain protein n=1 Tax=Streptomyces sp. NPDC056796 TaxID=3345947 RepID=UPI0036ADA419